MDHSVTTPNVFLLVNPKIGFGVTVDPSKALCCQLYVRRSCISETELVEILQRGLRSRIRQLLIIVSINVVALLRNLCITGETFLMEIAKSNTQRPQRQSQ